MSHGVLKMEPWKPDSGEKRNDKSAIFDGAKYNY